MSIPDRLRERWALRKQRIQDSLQKITEELDSAKSPPGGMIVAAVAWILNSIYTDVEEVFKGIAEAFGDEVPRSESWHRDLLLAMRKAGVKRRAVISDDLFISLGPLLAFRHRSRNATFLDLDWIQMQPLVESLASVLQAFEREVDAFLRDPIA